jgi:hypothetical protein
LAHAGAEVGVGLQDFRGFGAGVEQVAQDL